MRGARAPWGGCRDGHPAPGYEDCPGNRKGLLPPSLSPWMAGVALVLGLSRDSALECREGGSGPSSQGPYGSNREGPLRGVSCPCSRLL